MISVQANKATLCDEGDSNFVVCWSSLNLATNDIKNYIFEILCFNKWIVLFMNKDARKIVRIS